MYAIFKIIYGHPITEKEYGDEDFELNPMPHLFEDEEDGFLTYYSGAGAGIPRAFGVELGEFDECSFTYPDQLKLAPTAEQEEQYKDAYDALPVVAMEVIDRLGPPRVFFLPTTS